MAVYDDEKQKLSKDSGTPSDAELRRLTGIGPKEEKGLDKAAKKGAAEDTTSGGLYNPHGDGAAEKAQKMASMAQLAVGGNRMQAAKQIFWGTKRRKQTTIGGSIAGLIATIFAIVSLFILPLKIVSLVEDVQNHFFASSEQATSDMTEKLMQHYIVQKVMPGMVDKKCSSTLVSKSCARVSDKKTVVGQLYEAWRTNNFEEKLAKNHGFEVIKKGNKFYFRSDNLQHRIFAGEYDPKRKVVIGNKAFTELSRGELRQEAKAAVASETLWKRALYRFKIGKLLENKYKLTRCVMSCKLTGNAADKIHDKLEVRKRAFKAYFNDKVIKPRSKMLGLAFDCALSGFDCTGGDEVGPDGEHTDEFDRNVATTLDETRRTASDADLAELDKAAADIEEKGITRVLAERIIGEATTAAGSKAIPIIGWIDLAARLSQASHNAPQAIKTMNYTMYAATAAETWMLYRSSADEIKDGDIDGTVAGSVATSLDANPKTDQGGLSAEQSPLYHQIIDNGSGGTGASVASMVTPSFAAATSSSAPVEKCNDGSTLKSIACPELMVGHLSLAGNAIVMATTVSNFFAVPGSQHLVSLWINSVGKVLDWVGNKAGKVLTFLLKHFPPTKYIMDHADEFTAYMAKIIVSVIFPNPLGDKPSGARLFEVGLGAGPDFSAQTAAHYGQGGMVLSTKQSAAVYERQQDEQKQTFEAKPLLARMFSTSDPMSLISRLAVATPSSFGSASSSFFGTISSILSNPLQPFGQLAAVGFGGSQASAASGTDPFGIKQYGIPTAIMDKLLAKTGGDPAGYEAKYCQDPQAAAQTWGNAAVKDDETGQYDNYSVNLCATIQTAAAAAGCLFDPSIDPDCTTDTGSSLTDSGNLVLATYNLLNADGHAPDSIHVAGGCDTSSDRACLHKRATLQAKIIMGQDNNPQIDLIGTQETSPDQYRALRTDLTGYDGVPSLNDNADVNSMVRDQDGATSIIWNTAKLTKFAEGKTPAISNVANNGTHGHITAPWVGLQDASGQKYYVTSIHYPNSHFVDPSLGDKGTVLAAARLTMEWVRNMKQRDPTATEIIMGDFNDEPWQQNSYCVYTQQGLMTNTYDMAKGNDTSKPCPTKQHIGAFAIDQIYVSQNNSFTGATGWTHMGKDAITSHSSDHTPVYVTMNMPGGDSSSSSAGGLSWPVDASWWKKDRNDFLDGHGFTSGTFTSPYVLSTSSDISSPPGGTPIYSMLAGQVTVASSCDIQVKTSIQGGTLLVAYGHGTNHKVNVGDQVSSGQQMETEYHNCKATGDHVHIDMTFNGKHLCPQDVFLAMGKNETPDFAALANKIKPPTSCARV